MDDRNVPQHAPSPAHSHAPVLPAQVLRTLAPRAGETYIDCTAGLGGHAALIAAAIVPGGTVVLNDLDPENLRRAEERVSEAWRVGSPPPQSALPNGPTGAEHPSTPSLPVISIRGNFADAPRRVLEAGLCADLILADLGFSSNQMSDPSRGFSFSRDGPLDMRLDPNAGMTAADLVNGLPESELAQIIAEFGEDHASARIARKLVQERRREPITTTSRLADLVRSVRGPHHDRSAINPATKTFQALRIAVNDELGSLDAFLAGVVRGAITTRGAERERAGSGASWLRPGARLAVISFHSLEDRRVKLAFAEMQERGLGTVLTGAPLTADDNELATNPRSRSAKLRAIRIAEVRRAV